MADRIGLDIRLGQRLARQGRQTVRQREAQVGAPEAHQAGQPLARARGFLPHGCQFRRCLGIKDLITRLIEFVDRAGLTELLGERRGRFGGFGRIVQQAGQFVGRYRPVIRTPYIRCQAQRRQSCTQLRLPEALACNLRAERQGRQRQDVAHYLPLDLACAVARDAREREGWIGRR